MAYSYNKICHTKTEIIDSANELISNVPEIERAYILSCKCLRHKRTLNQNSGYWLWMGFLQDKTGHTKEFWHDYFLDRYPIYQTKILFNEVELYKSGTSSANTKQMSEHMNKIDLHCLNEFEIELPDLKSKQIIALYNELIDKGIL